MSNALEQVLGYVNLTGTIQTTTTGIPDPMPPAFDSFNKQTLADSGRYTKVTGTRTVAKTGLYGSPARRVNLKNVASMDIKLLHSFEEIEIDAKTFAYLRSKDSYQVDEAKEEVRRQIQEFNQRFENLRIAAKVLMLANGKLWFDSVEGGNLLSSSGSANLTLDAGVAATHQTTLNGIIDVSWANPAADVRTHVTKVKRAAVQSTGFPVRHAFYGLNVPSYLAKNDTVLDYLARNTAGNGEWVSEGEIGRLFGIEWHPMYEAFFEDSAGTNQSIWGDDLVVFAPEPAQGWWERLDGSFEVPTNINVQAEGVAAFQSLKRVWGKFGYSLARFNPPGASSFYGDTFLYVLKNPDAVFQATVAF